MELYVTQYGTKILSCSNVNLVPRIGDKISIHDFYYEVKDVVWHTENTRMKMWVEVKI